jgi:hypothetical protein
LTNPQTSIHQRAKEVGQRHRTGMAGVDLLVVSRTLGHHSPAFTVDTYAHVTKDTGIRPLVGAIFGGRDE